MARRDHGETFGIVLDTDAPGGPRWRRVTDAEIRLLNSDYGRTPAALWASAVMDFANAPGGIGSGLIPTILLIRASRYVEIGLSLGCQPDSVSEIGAGRLRIIWTAHDLFFQMDLIPMDRDGSIRCDLLWGDVHLPGQTHFTFDSSKVETITAIMRDVLVRGDNFRLGGGLPLLG